MCWGFLWKLLAETDLDWVREKEHTLVLKVKFSAPLHRQYEFPVGLSDGTFHILYLV